MTRYFYTCPLMASYMAKHFGMIFQQFNLRGDKTTICEFVCVSISDTGVFYIHPDSVKLLEPQEGDLFLADHHQCSDCGTEMFFYTDDYGKDAVKKIIQRNGIAFMWPNQEALVK